MAQWSILICRWLELAFIVVADNFYFPDKPTGSGRLAFDLATALARKGHSVYFLCQGAEGSHKEYEQDNGMTILRYHLSTGKLPALFFRHEQHYRAISSLLARYLPTPPDVIHGHAPLQYLACRKALGARGCWCYSVHSPAAAEMNITWGSQGTMGNMKRVLGVPMIDRMERGILQWSTFLTAESEYTKSMLRDRHGAPLSSRVRVIHGWIDRTRFRTQVESTSTLRHGLGWPESQPVVFSIRRLEPRMGLDNLLRAYAILRADGVSFHAVIAGAGSQESKLRRMITELRLDSFVSLIGRVSDEDLPKMYAACDVSIIPTAQLECFGLTAIEALACGRPVLVSPIGALPELINEFEPAWTAPSASPEGLAEAIRNYLKGVLPPYNVSRIAARLEHYSLERGFAEYCDCLSLGNA